MQSSSSLFPLLCGLQSLESGGNVGMGQTPNRTPSEHPNPTTQIGSKMGGEFTYPPKWDPQTVFTTTMCAAAPCSPFRMRSARLEPQVDATCRGLRAELCLETQVSCADVAVVVKTSGIPFWGIGGEFTTHFRTYFSGDWDVHWGYDLDFDP